MKVVDCVSAAVTCVPDAPLVPVHPPDAVQLLALVDDQLNVDVPPLATCAGFALIEIVGKGGVALTATVAVLVSVPPAPVQVSVYV
jgi:hypothetical protein